MKIWITFSFVLLSPTRYGKTERGFTKKRNKQQLNKRKVGIFLQKWGVWHWLLLCIWFGEKEITEFFKIKKILSVFFNLSNLKILNLTANQSYAKFTILFYENYKTFVFWSKKYISQHAIRVCHTIYNIFWHYIRFIKQNKYIK